MNLSEVKNPNLTPLLTHSYIDSRISNFFYLQYLEKVVDIFINEDISNKTVNRILQEILSNKEKETLTIYINSQGGDADCGYVLYEILKLAGCKIITYAINEVYSTAIIIYLAGDERYATEHSTFMIHEPMHVYEDTNIVCNMTTRAYIKNLKELQKSTNDYFNLISKHTYLTPQKIRNYILRTERGDWYFSPSLAKKYGMVTKIGVPFI